MRRIVIWCCVFALVSVACRGQTDTVDEPTSPASSAAGTTSPDEPPCMIENASTAPRESENEPPTSPVTDVRYDESSGCPRVVFEFSDQVAGYKVDYVQPPITDCGEGREIPTDSWKATAFMTVRLFPSGGPEEGSETGEPSYKGPRDIAVENGKILKHLKVICDFEGVFTWLIGLDAKHPFDVVTFEDAPPRLVIDISEV
jgi:hypothetical protein